MRWDALFTDLEAQLHSASVAHREGEIRDRTRTEQSRVTMSQRLIAQIGRHLSVSTRGGRTVSGLVTNVGSAWVSLVVEGRSVVVPFTAVQVLRELDRVAGQPLTGVEARLGFGSVLRELSRDRSVVALWLGSPAAQVIGVIERVGADFLELGLSSAGQDRRSSQGREGLTIPFTSIDTVDAAHSGA
ncbi:hypothetical protein [Arthrobacter sp. N1]|uniref:hypothetical protein n=1 Tax=Arthrobacter sp. N1 TaxID=619291 RepID=UPI003BB1F40A